jgi:hypothetical protein
MIIINKTTSSPVPHISMTRKIDGLFLCFFVCMIVQGCIITNCYFRKALGSESFPVNVSAILRMLRHVVSKKVTDVSDVIPALSGRRIKARKLGEWMG